MVKTCPIAWETLVDDHEGRLEDGARARLRSHLDEGCLVCQERLRWLADNIPALGRAMEPAPLPSTAARAYVRDLARLLPASRSTPARLRLFATLISGGGPAPIVAGVRGSVPAARQRVFATGDHWITLWEEPEEAGRCYLIGQVYSQSGETLFPESVHLFQPGLPEREAVQEDSEFHLQGVSPGDYLLRCRLSTADIFIPDVAVGPE